MRKALMILPFAALLAAPAVQSEEAEKPAIQLTEKQQKRYDRIIGDRVPTGTVSCISYFERRNLQVISDDILVFGQNRNAKRLYVNKPYGGCPDAEHETLIVDLGAQTNYCNGEIIRVVDTTTGTFRGSCALSQFTVYEKPATTGAGQ